MQAVYQVVVLLNFKVSFSRTVSAHEEKMMKFYEKFRGKLIKERRSLFELHPIC